MFIKKIDNQEHNIKFLNEKKLEALLKKEISDIDILIIDRVLLKNNHIRRIYDKFSKRTFLLKGHEKIKTLSNFNLLIEKILKIGVQRKSKLISIGGGTIGDLSGFISSSLLRGIDHLIIPSSLLAMVDSSIGGKTGINSNYGKNLIGSFHLPKKVLICTDLLKTLPRRELNCGFAEIIKYSLICPSPLKNKLINFNYDNKKNLSEIIKLSLITKLKYIDDFRERSSLRNSRAILNFGHTIGHAIENSNSYKGNMKHGEAISLGMIIELKISNYLKYYRGSIKDNLFLLKKFNLPTNYEDFLSSKNINNLISKMKFDKKTIGAQISFIFIDSKGGFVKKISFEKIKDLLNKIN